MRVASRQRGVSGRRSAGRRGTVGLAWLIVTGIATVAVLVSVQRVTIQRHLQLELQVTADAMVHAVAADLAKDTALAENVAARETLMTDCRRTGRRFGELNHVGIGHVRLRDNPGNRTNGEIVLGAVDLHLPKPKDREFDVTPKTTLTLQHPDLNAVRVTLRRRGATASALGLADHDVVGFRVHEGLAETKIKDYRPPALPLAPVAIYSRLCEPDKFGPECWGAVADESWEYRILARKGADRWRLDPATGRPQTCKDCGDGIPEIDVVLSEGSRGGDNGQPVRFHDSMPETATALQTRAGVTYKDLQARRGELLLNDGKQLQNELLLPRQTLSEDGIDLLAQALTGIIGQPRVFLLYSEIRKDDATGEKVVVVVGFVAARVMAVSTDTKVGLGSGGKSLTYGQVTATLQPTVMNVPAALTDSRPRDLGPRPLYNPYIARVRVVD